MTLLHWLEYKSIWYVCGCWMLRVLYIPSSRGKYSPSYQYIRPTHARPTLLSNIHVMNGHQYFHNNFSYFICLYLAFGFAVGQFGP